MSNKSDEFKETLSKIKEIIEHFRQNLNMTQEEFEKYLEDELDEEENENNSK